MNKENSSNNNEGNWLCLPSVEGLFIIYKPEQSDTKNSSTIDGKLIFPNQKFDGKGFLLPCGLLEDKLLDEPPLSILLTDEEIAELKTEQDNSSFISAIAATSYGPLSQDKKSNEDYALSAIMKDSYGKKWAFAVVADGVSTKTFWSARTARIACLVAFKVIRKFVLSNGNIDNTSLEKLREDLVAHLQKELNKDKELLMEEDIYPANWATNLYKEHIYRDELWYNSTLLIAVLGPSAGFLVWAGDGGLELVKTKLVDVNQTDTNVVNTVVLRSTDNVTISNFISLAVSTSDLQMAKILYDNSLLKVDVYVSTDGVDRTIQMNAGSISYHNLKLESSVIANQQLNELWKLPEHENDNFSLAYVSRYIKNSSSLTDIHSEIRNPNKSFDLID